MTKFITSDTHFGHKNVLKFDNSPFFTIEEQDNAIVENWNSVVGPNDEVFHLGDFALSSVSYAENIFNRLNGKIYLIKGNHEKTALDRRLRSRFQFVRDYFELKDNKETFCLFHYPIHEWNKCHHGAYMLHGHTHGHDTYSEDYKRLNMGIMLHNFFPLSLDEIREKLKYKKIFKHH